MRIAVISTPIFPCPPTGYSGLEAIAYHVAQGLVYKGHQVTLVAPHGSKIDGGALMAFGLPGQVTEEQAYESYKGQLKHCDVIIDHSWKKLAYKGKQDNSLKAPVLGVTHAPIDTMMRQLPPNVEKPSFVCISQDQANHFQGLYQRPARVAYNGIDLDFYRDINLKRNRRFLFLARFSTIKGPDIAIRACRDANVGLDLIGDTSITNEPDYFKLCCDMADNVLSGPYRKLTNINDEKAITIHGGVGRGQTVWWYSKNHCLVHPVKNFREPFGLVPVEAQACGMPVISWDNGAMRETVSEHTGRLVASEEDLAKAIKYHSDNEIALSEPFGTVREACRKQAEKFSIQNMVDRYLVLCEEAVRTGGW